jgi:hypothetical protein
MFAAGSRQHGRNKFRPARRSQATYCACADGDGGYSRFDHTARNDLAKKFAIMPGATTADFSVVSACAQKLSI